MEIRELDLIEIGESGDWESKDSRENRVSRNEQYEDKREKRAGQNAGREEKREKSAGKNARRGEKKEKSAGKNARREEKKEKSAGKNAKREEKREKSAGRNERREEKRERSADRNERREDKREKSALRRESREVQKQCKAEKHRKTENQRLKRRRRRRRLMRTMALMVSLAAAIALLFIVVKLTDSIFTGNTRGAVETTVEIVDGNAQKWKNNKWGDFYAVPLEHPPLDVQLLTVNEYSRPGELLPEVKNIFVHYTANAGTSAIQNRSYFQSLADTHERSASAHFVIGYDGEIVQCIPTKEIAYAVMQRNYDSISIECCYLNENGIFTKATYDSLIKLTAWLLHKYELTPEDVLRHYDEGGKNCPKYYVENEEEWQTFLRDLTSYMEKISQSA